jgi:hypothetical protein
MNQKSSHANQGAAKVYPSPSAMTLQMGQSSSKRDQRTASTASPTPVWARYVDSRLKQFCTR